MSDRNEAAIKTLDELLKATEELIREQQSLKEKLARELYILCSKAESDDTLKEAVNTLRRTGNSKVADRVEALEMAIRGATFDIYQYGDPAAVRAADRICALCGLIKP